MFIMWMHSTKEMFTGVATYAAAPTAPSLLAPYPVTQPPLSLKNGSADIWWHYPIFTLGSYAQITNNIRHPNNPDEGTCTPASMCGALYREKNTGSNYYEAPAAPTTGGTRIGYFNSA
jgi:hypothetical protein